jgi:serine protease
VGITKSPQKANIQARGRPDLERMRQKSSTPWFRDAAAFFDVCRGLLVLGIAISLPLAAAAQPRSGKDAVGVKPLELIVRLSSEPGGPAAEEVVRPGRVGATLPAGLSAGSPVKVRFAITQRLAGEARRRLLANPQDPRARLERYIVLSYPATANLAAIAAALAGNPWVESVQENLPVQFAIEPSDPEFPIVDRNGNPAPSPDFYQWGSYALNLPAAWDRIHGHAYVGVLDNGIEVRHPDLQAFHPSGSTFGYDGGNFRPHLSWSFAEHITDVDESLGGEFRGHGTHVSGIIAATTDNARGVAGTCWNCSLIMTRVAGSSDVANGIVWQLDHGAQMLNMSFFITAEPEIVRDALAAAEQRDVAMFAASGNARGPINFPANDPRVIAVGGLAPDGSFWEESSCPPGECGSNFGPQQALIAPARNVLSTFYANAVWNSAVRCGDTAHAGIGYDVCTGTSMSTPYVTGVAGLLRSVNPLLTKGTVRTLLISNASRASQWDERFGYGVPDAAKSADATLGKSNGVVLRNRLTPLFSLYSAAGGDHLYTTVPQAATAAISGTLQESCDGLTVGGCERVSIPYAPVGPAVPGYLSFPGVAGTPRASVYLFSGDRDPGIVGAPPLVPLYRMSYRSGMASDLNRDYTYTTETAGLVGYRELGYELDGIEGYIFRRCNPEPGCIPAGAVRLWRQYHSGRDDHAIFPESELAQMQASGYGPAPGENDILGYVYPNVDSDGDQLVDGFESLIGTNPQRTDSDCDGTSDGTEVLNYPYGDPLGSPGCTLPRAARVLSQNVPATMVAGRKYAVSVTLQNAGTLAWNPIGPQCSAYRLGSANPLNNGTWLPATRVELPAPLAPAGQVTLNFTVTAPSTPGTYNYQWQMVQECVTWFGDPTPNVVVTVQPAPPRDAQIIVQNVPSTMTRGQNYPVSIRVRNVGTQTWNPIGPQCNAYRLGSANPLNNGTWLPATRVELPAPLAQGGEATLNFTITAPSTPGTYNFQWRMVQECVVWFGDFTPNVAVSVN